MEAPLRIRAPAVGPDSRQTRDSLRTQGDGKSPDSYVQRLIKLIPAEVVTAYLVGREIAGEHEFGEQWAAWCLLATVVFRSIMTYEMPKGAKPRKLPYLSGIEWPAVLIAVISFSIWVFSLGDKYPSFLPSLEQWQATLVLLLWTPFAPLVYKGAAAPQPGKPPAPKRDGFVAKLIAGKPGKGLSEDGTAAGSEDPLAYLRIPEATEPRLAPRLPGPIRRGRIGQEDRKRVRDASVDPFNQIVLLHAFARGERLARKMGTGWFLTPSLVVTAGHVIYDPAAFGEDGVAHRVFGWPGFTNTGSAVRSFEAFDVHIHPHFERDLRKDCDVALIELDHRFEGFGLTIAGSVAQDISVAGYPGDLGSGRTMFNCLGKVVSVEQGFVFHDADTSHGQSGAPILAEDGEAAVVGIHVDGKDRSDHLAKEANLGLLFHPEIHDWLKQF